MSHARRFDLEAVKLSAKRSNVYGLSNYFWQRKLRFRNRDYHRAAKLYLKSLFDRTLNRLELKLIPKLGQDYPNLFERWRNLNLGLYGFRIFLRSFGVKSLVKNKVYGDYRVIFGRIGLFYQISSSLANWVI